MSNLVIAPPSLCVAHKEVVIKGEAANRIRGQHTCSSVNDLQQLQCVGGSVTALYEFESGSSGMLATVRATPLFWRLHVFGSQGSAEVRGETELVLRMSGQPVERHELASVDSLRLVLEAFADAVDGRHHGSI